MLTITWDGPTLYQPDQSLVLNHSPAPPGIPGITTGTGTVAITP
jgi:hypothetical protein